MLIINLQLHMLIIIKYFSETDLKQLENSAQIFNALSDIPGDIDDVDQLFNVCFLNIILEIYYNEVQLFSYKLNMYFRYL